MSSLQSTRVRRVEYQPGCRGWSGTLVVLPPPQIHLSYRPPRSEAHDMLDSLNSVEFEDDAGQCSGNNRKSTGLEKAQLFCSLRGSATDFRHSIGIPL